MENYVKSRLLSNSYEYRDAEKIKECGQRLKWIQTRLREIETKLQQLKEEKERMSKG